MNGKQARAMQAAWDDSWLWWLPFNPTILTESEYELLYALYEEYCPDAGNLYRIPLINREED